MIGMGFGAFAGHGAAGESAYDAVGSAWRRERQAERGTHKKELQELLLRFAASHSSELHNDPELGAEFVQLLGHAGIDVMALEVAPPPTAARADTEFLYRLGVRIIEACEASAGWNGTVLPVGPLVDQLNASAAEATGGVPVRRITTDDVVAAMELQAELGPGIELVTLSNGQKVIQTAMLEIGSDQDDVLAACDVLGYVTAEMLADNFEWMPDAIERVLDNMVSTGLLWIDAQSTPTAYWSPGVFL